MRDRHTIPEAVLRMLESWPSFDVVRRVLEGFTDLDWFVAGGVVRDTLLGVEDQPKDVDLFVKGVALRKVVERLAEEGSVERGPFGAPRWTHDGDGAYMDVIGIESFRNGLWICRDIVDVLNQFDFTCNAVAVDLRSGVVFDPQNGVLDAGARVMRAVRFDYPDEPFVPGAVLSRPAVLWFRILHYAALKGLTIEPVTLRWLKSRRYDEQQHEFADKFFSPHALATRPLDPP